MPGVRHKDTERTYTGDISEDEPWISEGTNREGIHGLGQVIYFWIRLLFSKEWKPVSEANQFSTGCDVPRTQYLYSKEVLL